MAETFPPLRFSKSWENPEDFPTIQTSEAQNRADLQQLHDETRDYLNNTLSHFLNVMPAPASVQSDLEALDERVTVLEAGGEGGWGGGGGGGGADPRVPGLLSRMAQAETDIDSLKSADTALDTRVTRTETVIDGVIPQLGTSVETLDRRVTALENSGGGDGGSPVGYDDTGLRTRIESLETTSSGTIERVSTLEQTASSITSRVSAIETDANGLRTRMSTIEQTAESITAQVEDIEDTVDGYSARISTVEQTAAGITTRVSAIETDNTGTKSRVSTLEQTAAGFATRVEDVEDTVDGYSSRISAVEQTASGLTSRVSAVEQTATGLTGSVNTLEQTAAQTTSTIANLDGRVSQIRQTVDDITFTVSEPTAGGYVTMALTVGGNTYRGVVKIDGNVDISGELSAQALYANHGDIADLVVDRLRTSRRIPKYLARDTSDDNFIRAEGQVLQFVTASTSGSSVQASDPFGALLYWEQDVSGAALGSDGYPYVNGSRVFVTTGVTNYPVMVYAYTELVKRQIAFQNVGGTYVPCDVFGAGDGSGRNQGTLVKRTDALELSYTTTGGKSLGLTMGNDGFTDITGLRRTVALDLSALGDGGGTITERVEGDETLYSYGVTIENNAVTIDYGDGSSLVVTL